MACVAASIVTRLASHYAYERKKLGLVTPDIIEILPDIVSLNYD